MLVAHIREAECIGCTKCIQACPVDAILGSTKQMHTVIATECTGCELCVAPCPVDCIDMLPSFITQDRSEQFKNRTLARQKRLQQMPDALITPPKSLTSIEKKDYIQAAILRAKAKKDLSFPR